MQFRWETYTIFYVNAENCAEIQVEDVIAGERVSLETWRNLRTVNSSPKKIGKTKKTVFTDLFNEGTFIHFTPKDLDKSTPEIQNFKRKLASFESGIGDTQSFDPQNLSYLINNETFFDSQYYVNSTWLRYFIEKYEMDVLNLNEVMKQAITQEDLKAVLILIDNGYIISEVELNLIEETFKNIKTNIEDDKKEGYQSYLTANSKINQIKKVCNKRFRLNGIQDKDGFTNLRKDKSSTSPILMKIKSGETIKVLDNSGDWFLVKTRLGKQGYIHRSRVKPE